MANLLPGVTLTIAGSVTWSFPERANDGSLASGASYAPAGVYSPGADCFIVADFGADVVATLAEALMSEAAPNYRVWSSPDGSSWTERVEVADWSLAGTEGGASRYTAPLATTARYWRFGMIFAGGYDGGNYAVEFRLDGEFDTGEVVDPSDPPPYSPPAVGGAIIEIYTADPDGAKWGEAVWGTDVWAASGWQDITPLSVMADVEWGVDDPALGILATPKPGSWTVLGYDPDRDLDPANATSPYVGYLDEGTPIRVNHRAMTLRTGIIESIAYGYAQRTVRIRATDALGRLQASVPDDATLADTLWARATDAITEAGIRDVGIRRGRPEHDAPLSAKPDGRLTVLRHLTTSAQEALALLWVHRDGRLAWRFWSALMDRGTILPDTELIDLTSYVDGRGRVSVVSALDEDGVTTTERVYTPTPAYGKRRYDRPDTTIDSAGWCDRVLADRVASPVRFLPGEIRPLDADRLELLASIEVGEVVTVDTEDVAEVMVVLGGRFRVAMGMYAEDASGDPVEVPVWRWQFQVTRATGGEGSFLVDDDDGYTLVDDDDADTYLLAEA